MSIKMTATFDGLTKAVVHLKKVLDYVDNSGEDIALAGFNAAGTIFEKNFDAGGKGSGLGGWAALKEKTVAERERKGFGGERPILIRYHDLRTISASALRVAGGSGTFSATDPDGKTIRMTLNVGKDGGYAQITGDKAWNQVKTRNAEARPFWFTTATVIKAVRKRAIATLADNIERLK